MASRYSAAHPAGQDDKGGSNGATPIGVRPGAWAGLIAVTREWTDRLGVPDDLDLAMFGDVGPFHREDPIAPHRDRGVFTRDRLS